ncbi:hypothetical protein ACFQ6B_23665 [Streptomyces wedmorensis]|uniref:Uncharacterized protein n=1 Tax=Streptomyces wedmorensis TaxID=43759 RepID=A0ABW6J925_STRWE
MSTRTPGICLNCEHPVPAHGEEVCGQPSTFPDGTPYQCGCTWGDDDQDDAAEEPAPAPVGDHFTEAAIRRSAYLDAANLCADDGPEPCGCGGCADCALYQAAQQLRRRAEHYTTAEQPTGPTWEARADHAIRLYATTAIERDDARAEAARLRARVTELEADIEALQRDKEAVAGVAERARVRLAELEGAAEKVAQFCAARAEYVDNLRQHSSSDADYHRWSGHAAARRQLAQLLGLPVAWPAEAAADEEASG